MTLPDALVLGGFGALSFIAYAAGLARLFTASFCGALLAAAAWIRVKRWWQ